MLVYCMLPTVICITTLPYDMPTVSSRGQFDRHCDEETRKTHERTVPCVSGAARAFRPTGSARRQQTLWTTTWNDACWTAGSAAACYGATTLKTATAAAALAAVAALKHRMTAMTNAKAKHTRARADEVRMLA